jgi:hypothetical protein
MSDPFQPDTTRDTLVFLVELGGMAVVAGAGVLYGLRKAFRFTDAFERETPPKGQVRDEGGTCFPPEPAKPGPDEKPPDAGPMVRSNRIS